MSCRIVRSGSGRCATTWAASLPSSTHPASFVIRRNALLLSTTTPLTGCCAGSMSSVMIPGVGRQGSVSACPTHASTHSPLCQTYLMPRCPAASTPKRLRFGRRPDAAAFPRNGSCPRPSGRSSPGRRPASLCTSRSAPRNRSGPAVSLLTPRDSIRPALQRLNLRLRLSRVQHSVGVIHLMAMPQIGQRPLALRGDRIPLQPQFRRLDHSFLLRLPIISHHGGLPLRDLALVVLHLRVGDDQLRIRRLLAARRQHLRCLLELRHRLLERPLQLRPLREGTHPEQQN